MKSGYSIGETFMNDQNKPVNYLQMTEMNEKGQF